MDSIYFQLDFQEKTYYLSFESVTTDVNYFPYLSSVPELNWGGDGYLKVFTGSIRIFREATVASKSLSVDVAPYHPFAGNRLNDLISYKEKIPFRIYTDLTEDPVISGNLVLSEITDEEIVLMVMEEDYESRSVRPVLEKSSAMFVDRFSVFVDSETANKYLLVQVGSNTMFDSQELIFERISKSETEASVRDIFEDIVFQTEPKEENERRYLISDRSTNDFLIKHKETSEYVKIDDIIDSSDLPEVISTLAQVENQVFEGKLGMIYNFDSKYDPVNQYICGGYSVNPIAFGKVQVVSPVIPYGDRYIRKDYLEHKQEDVNPPQEIKGSWSEMVNDRIIDSIPYQPTIPAFPGKKNEGSTVTFFPIGSVKDSFVISGGDGNYTNSLTPTWSGVHWMDEFAFLQNENAILFSQIGGQSYIYGVHTQTPYIDSGQTYYRVKASGGPFQYKKGTRTVYSGVVTDHDPTLDSHYTKLSSPSYSHTGTYTDSRAGTSGMSFRTYNNGSTTLYSPQSSDSDFLGSGGYNLTRGYFYQKVPNTGAAATQTEDGLYWITELDREIHEPISSGTKSLVSGVTYRDKIGSDQHTIYGRGTYTNGLSQAYFQIDDGVLVDADSQQVVAELYVVTGEYSKRTYKTGKTTNDNVFYEWLGSSWGERLNHYELWTTYHTDIVLKFTTTTGTVHFQWQKEGHTNYSSQIGSYVNHAFEMTSFRETATHTVYTSNSVVRATFNGNKNATSHTAGDYTYNCPSGVSGQSYFDIYPYKHTFTRPTGTASTYDSDDFNYSPYTHVDLTGSSGDLIGEESLHSLIDLINYNGINITYHSGSGVGNGFNSPQYRMTVNGNDDTWELSTRSVPYTFHNTHADIVLEFEKIERVAHTGWIVPPSDEVLGHATTPEYRTNSARKYVYRENKTPTYHNTVNDKAEGYDWRSSVSYDSTEPYYLSHVDTLADTIKLGSLTKRITLSTSMIPDLPDAKNLPIFLDIDSVVDHADHSEKIYGLWRNTVQNDKQFLDLITTDQPPAFSFTNVLDNATQRDWNLSITGLSSYTPSVSDTNRPEYMIKYHVYGGAKCISISETKGGSAVSYTPDDDKNGKHFTDFSSATGISQIDLKLSKTKEFDDDVTNSLVGIDVWVYRRVTPKASVVSSEDTLYACCGCYYKLEIDHISYDQSGSCSYIDCHTVSQSVISTSADRAVYSIRNPSLRIGTDYGLVVYDEGAALDDESELLYTASDNQFINLTHVPFGQLAISGWSIYGSTIYDFFKNFIIPKLQIEDSTIADEPDITYAVGSKSFNLNFYQSDEVSVLELAKDVCSKSNYIFYFNTLNQKKNLVLVDLNQSLSVEGEEVVTTRSLSWSGKSLQFHANFLTTKKWNNFVTTNYHADFKPPSSWIDDNKQVIILNPVDVHIDWYNNITAGQTWESTITSHQEEDVLALYPQADTELPIWQRAYYEEFMEGDSAWIIEKDADYSEIIDEWVFPMKDIPRAFHGFESLGSGRSYIYHRNDLTSDTYTIHSDSLLNKCKVPCTIRKYYFNHSLVNSSTGETHQITYDTICLVLDPHYLFACPTNATEVSNNNHVADWNDSDNKLFMPNTSFVSGLNIYESPFQIVYKKTVTPHVEEKTLEYGKIDSINIDFKFPIKNLIGRIEANKIYSAVKTEELVNVASRFASNQTMMKQTSLTFKEKISGIGNDEEIDLLAQNVEEGKLLLKRHAKTKSMPEVVVIISYIDFDIKIGDRLTFNDENRRLTISMIVTGMGYNVDEEKTSFRGIANITSIIEES